MNTFYDRIFKDKNGKTVIAQFPNKPIIIWFTTMFLANITSGALSDTLSFLSSLALIIWAILEIITGDSLFRKILGYAVLVGYLSFSLLL